jgi:glutathione S-transferase
MLDEHLRERTFFVGERYSIADIAIYAYTHVAPDAGFALGDYPAVTQWLRRVEAQPNFVNDLEPYPANAAAGAGRSLYD